MKPESPVRRHPVKYRQLPHTADMAWLIRGESLPQLFENAAAALVASMTDRRYIRRREKREIEVEAPDREALLVDWLNRLVYLFDVEGFWGREFQVSSLTDQHLQATAWGERFDPERHPGKTAVKAATYHHLEIGPRDGGWQATVILDL